MIIVAESGKRDILDAVEACLDGQRALGVAQPPPLAIRSSWFGCSKCSANCQKNAFCLCHYHRQGFLDDSCLETMTAMCSALVVEWQRGSGPAFYTASQRAALAFALVPVCANACSRILAAAPLGFLMDAVQPLLL